MICRCFYITTITLSDFPFALHHSFDSFNPLSSPWVHLGVHRASQNTKTKLLIFVERLDMFIFNQSQKMVPVTNICDMISNQTTSKWSLETRDHCSFMYKYRNTTAHERGHYKEHNTGKLFSKAVRVTGDGVAQRESQRDRENSETNR